MLKIQQFRVEEKRYNFPLSIIEIRTLWPGGFCVRDIAHPPQILCETGLRETTAIARGKACQHAIAKRFRRASYAIVTCQVEFMEHFDSGPGPLK